MKNLFKLFSVGSYCLFIPVFISVFVLLFLTPTLTFAQERQGLFRNRGNTQQQPQQEPSKWVKGEFVNEWGDKSGDFFMFYQGSFKGRYANSATNNGELVIKNIVFSHKQGYQFDVTTISGSGLLPAVTSINKANIKLVFLIDGTQYEFDGKNDGDTTVLIPLSDELLEILLAEPDIEYRITARMANARTGAEFGNPVNFQVTFKLDGFAKAYNSIIKGE